MKLFKSFATLALLLAVVSPVLADIASPDKKKPRADGEIRTDLPYSNMTIERVDGLLEARLQVPRIMLKRLNQSAGIQAGDSGYSFSLRGAGTVVAGFFLSLSLVLTGLLLVRSRRRVAVGRVAAALLLSVFAASAAGVAAYANAGPPPGYRMQDPGTLIKAASGKTLAGSIRIEVVDEGTEIKLLVPSKSGGRDDEE